MKNRTWLVLVLVLGILVAACGGDGGASSTTEGEAPGTTEPSDGATTTAGGGDGTTAPSGEGSGYEHLDQALAGDFDGTSVEIWAQWLPESSEAANFTATLAPFTEATGIEVNFQPTPDYETAL